MATYIFKKETKGFSITKEGLKVSYGNGVEFRGHVKGTTAQIRFGTFTDPLSTLDITPSSDTITVNEVLFAGTASELIDSLRDTVLFD